MSWKLTILTIDNFNIDKTAQVESLEVLTKLYRGGDAKYDSIILIFVVYFLSTL